MARTKADRLLATLRTEAAACVNCDLYAHATQTVFGDGSPRARLVVVGEQPGDQEDLAGEPFVGPAGRLLDDALEQAGIDRHEVYLTNAVKHFRWEERGTRRIHKKPNQGQIRACRPWLDGELAAIEPELIVALGATAGQALLGPQLRVTQERGKVLDPPDGLSAPVLVTVHPSSVLRSRQRSEDLARLVDDLRVAPKWLDSNGRSSPR